MKRLREWVEIAGTALVVLVALAVLLLAAPAATRKYLDSEPDKLTEVLKVLVWPAVVCVGLLAFRGQIGRFLIGLSHRVQKLSIFGTEIELTEVKAKTAPTPALNEIKKSEAMNVGDSGAQIFAQLQDETPADYVVIDIGDGTEWLSSRLFIVAVLFERMRGVRCIVFTEGAGENAGRFVGTASPQAVRWCLARASPWFEVAFARALTVAAPWVPASFPTGNQLVRNERGALALPVANRVAQEFIFSLQAASKPAGATTDWLKIHEPPREVWERAEWITRPRLVELLGTNLNTRSVPDANRRRKPAVVRDVLEKHDRPFVAGTTAADKFEVLFNRAAMLEELARLAVAESNPDETDG
jgi:hypothetical protein